ncbi:unnamed protein product, partial [Brenthis ino]
MVINGNAYFMHGADLRCYDGSINKFTVISLDDPTPLLNAGGFDSKRNTTIYTFGFEENTDSPDVQRITGVYLEFDVNILLLNWEVETDIPILGLASYRTIDVNVKQVGRKLGEAIIKLQDAGFYLPSLHLIGYSLGAHIMGYAGRYVKSKGYLISRITGLDPAGPLYNGLMQLSGLDSSTASFVDVIHANPGGLGTTENLGTVDIWPNCGQFVQPGCENNSADILKPTRNSCSHNRVWQYFSESLEEPFSFPARKAASCCSWKAGERTDEIIYMGDDVNRTAKGRFYLRTNSNAPYGLGYVGTEPAKIENDDGVL